VSDSTYDVAILGGGPAGAAAARLLASWGHSVVVLARGAARESMAESLPPSAAKLLDRVGVLGAVESAGFLRSTGNTVRWGTDETRVELFLDGALGYQLRRDVFDRVLLGAATIAGTAVLNDVSAREIAEPNADGVREIIYDGADGRRSVRARWVLDCTGRTGIVARRGWRTQTAAARTLGVVGIWECNPRWELANETHTIVESFDAGWAWSIPVSAQQRYVTVMVDPTHTAIGLGAELAATYASAISRTAAMRELVKQGSLVGMPWARESSPYAFNRAGDDGLLLVGDAASFVDPLSSFGIKKALASAWLAAVAVRASLRDATITVAALELYESREREMHLELQRRAVELSRDAAATHASGFWSDRTGATSPDADPQFSPASTATIKEAFEDIRRRPHVAFRRADTVELQPRAVVRGNDLAILPHLMIPSLPRAIRFLRNVDVVDLTELAPSFDQVPDLYEAYNRRTQSPAQLSDFLAALATLVGTGALALS
jgi:flavin-dependent dehydrogenase